VVVLIAGPDIDAADGSCCLLRVDAVHVHVLLVDRRGHRDLVGGKLARLVEEGPLRVAREDLGGVPQRAQGGILLEHPGIDHLASEKHGRVAFQGRLVPELREIAQRTLCRPASRRPLSVDRLVHDRVEGVAAEGDAGPGLLQEPVRQLGPCGPLDEGLLKHVVQCLRASGIPEA